MKIVIFIYYYKVGTFIFVVLIECAENRSEKAIYIIYKK